MISSCVGLRLNAKTVKYDVVSTAESIKAVITDVNLGFTLDELLPKNNPRSTKTSLKPLNL